MKKIDSVYITCCLKAIKELDRVASIAEKCSNVNRKAELCDYMLKIIKEISKNIR